ncbi:MAG: hypothetical protein IPL94_01205 [Tetrasphaera sp.]|nr:hypothetical protein [Tetrasphaera sp.]
MSPASPSPGPTVQFPLVDGARSTTSTGRAVVADALRAVDPVGASAAERTAGWRRDYLPHFSRLVESGLASPQAAVAIARAGLASLQSRMTWGEVPLGEAFSGGGEGLETEVRSGRGVPEQEVSLPYRGERLTGERLVAQLDRWVSEGVIEPSARAAVLEVMDHPQWLGLGGRTVVVLGAGAEMGPLRALLRWGARVAAVDLADAGLWRRVLADTEGAAGDLVVPVRAGAGSLAERAGLDLLQDLPAAGSWIEALAGPVVLGNYVYADGATNVRLAAGIDAMTAALLSRREDLSLAYLATPTDVFAVPGEAVAASAAAYEASGAARLLRGTLRTMSGGRVLNRNYVPGLDPGINDSVVLQQGPNYLLAKRVHRWRASAARADGVPVSLRVAPPTRTRSVVKNRALAAAYAGAHRFGIEVFEPGTANTLMAVLLVHDVMSGRVPEVQPWREEAFAAVHGGLWRTAYAPRSALGLAAALGFASAR